jgi:single-stranded DNA-binding protein
MSGIEVAFFGVLGRDGCEVKTSKSGKRYLRLNVRVGEADAQWITATVFDEKAVEVAEKLVKGAKVYIEGGGLKIDEWTGQDGAHRHGLSCMSWHCRLSEIGRNRPKRERRPATEKRPATALRTNDFHSDEIPF